MIHKYLPFLLWLLVTPLSALDDATYFETKARNGDGVMTMLGRYALEKVDCNVTEFYRLNQLNQGDYLLAGKAYKLPVLIYPYNGKSIRSTVGISDYDQALRIQKYNERLHKLGLRESDYRVSKVLWVPYHEIHCKVASSPTLSNKKGYHLPILGAKEADVVIKSSTLKDQVYYIISGHGGPDPGAVSQSGNQMLCEDEYAYDVSLRLYKLLLEQGAKVYMIIEDQNDGIRDKEILPCDQDERCRGAEIPLNQAKRLRQRVGEVNQLYHQNKKKGLNNQTCISIHVDSRSIHHRQDVFFCHYPTSNASRQLAESLQETFAKKYRKYRAGGHYEGEVDPRDNLYVLKNTLPKSVLVELANIQNKADHRRILDSSNRQALANWLLEGLIHSVK